MKIVVATRNQGKVRELSRYLSALQVDLLSLNDIGFTHEIAETGSTFCENARLKAETVANFCNFPVLADDSGLEVDALDGEPGVRSARFAGENATDELNNQKLLTLLKGQTNRRARFKCCLCFASPGKDSQFFEGTCEGNILTIPQGEGGFGYDPLFVPIGHEKSFATLSIQEKQIFSHRGKALKIFSEFLLA
jgi:non-canonical purine NTP pyrophosphatase (RdgB/HAM1 family)